MLGGRRQQLNSKPTYNWTVGGYLNSAGNWIENELYAVSDFIPVTGRYSTNSIVCWNVYRADKSRADYWIGQYPNFRSIQYQQPYIRINILISDYKSFQVRDENDNIIFNADDYMPPVHEGLLCL